MTENTKTEKGSPWWGWLRAKGASEYLNKSTNTLQVWRGRGYGPPWSKNGGHVAYKLADLEQWLQEQKVQPESSDLAEGEVVPELNKQGQPQSSIGEPTNKEPTRSWWERPADGDGS